MALSKQHVQLKHLRKASITERFQDVSAVPVLSRQSSLRYTCLLVTIHGPEQATCLTQALVQNKHHRTPSICELES